MRLSLSRILSIVVLEEELQSSPHWLIQNAADALCQYVCMIHVHT